MVKVLNLKIGESKDDCESFRIAHCRKEIKLEASFGIVLSLCLTCLRIFLNFVVNGSVSANVLVAFVLQLLNSAWSIFQLFLLSNFFSSPLWVLANPASNSKAQKLLNTYQFFFFFLRYFIFLLSVPFMGLPPYGSYLGCFLFLESVNVLSLSGLIWKVSLFLIFLLYSASVVVSSTFYDFDPSDIPFMKDEEPIPLKDIFLIYSIAIITVCLIFLPKQFIRRKDILSTADSIIKINRVVNTIQEFIGHLLPEHVIKQLSTKGEAVGEFFPIVTFVFVQLTSAEAVLRKCSGAYSWVSSLNQIYYEFDQLVEASGGALYKVENVEMEYLVVSGAPAMCPNHAQNIAGFARAITHISERLSHRLKVPLVFRMGIHSGPVTAGCHGNVMLQYSFFGDTVNTTSRMMTTAFPGQIQMSEATFQLLRSDPQWAGSIQYCDSFEVKGKGTMNTYLLDNSEMSQNFTYTQLSTTGSLLSITRTDSLSSSSSAGSHDSHSHPCTPARRTGCRKQPSSPLTANLSPVSAETPDLPGGVSVDSAHDSGEMDPSSPPGPAMGGRDQAPHTQPKASALAALALTCSSTSDEESDPSVYVDGPASGKSVNLAHDVYSVNSLFSLSHSASSEKDLQEQFVLHHTFSGGFVEPYFLAVMSILTVAGYMALFVLKNCSLCHIFAIFQLCLIGCAMCFLAYAMLRGSTTQTDPLPTYYRQVVFVYIVTGILTFTGIYQFTQCGPSVVMPDHYSGVITEASLFLIILCFLTRVPRAYALGFGLYIVGCCALALGLGQAPWTHVAVWVVVLTSVVVLCTTLTSHFARSSRSSFFTLHYALETKQGADYLLSVLVPPHVLPRLANGDDWRRRIIADELQLVVLMQSDVVGFTSLCAQLHASRVVDFIHKLFSLYDRAAALTGIHNLYRIGDSYVAAAGLEQAPTDSNACRGSAGIAKERLRVLHAVRDICCFARVTSDLLQEAVGLFQEFGLASGVSMRSGIALGRATAGLVGRLCPRYLVWGPAVERCRAMEQGSQPGKIRIHPQTLPFISHNMFYSEKVLVSAPQRSVSAPQRRKFSVDVCGFSTPQSTSGPPDPPHLHPYPHPPALSPSTANKRLRPTSLPFSNPTLAPSPSGPLFSPEEMALFSEESGAAQTPHPHSPAFRVPRTLTEDSLPPSYSETNRLTTEAVWEEEGREGACGLKGQKTEDDTAVPAQLQVGAGGEIKGESEDGSGGDGEVGQGVSAHGYSAIKRKHLRRPPNLVEPPPCFSPTKALSPDSQIRSEVQYFLRLENVVFPPLSTRSSVLSERDCFGSMHGSARRLHPHTPTSNLRLMEEQQSTFDTPPLSPLHPMYRTPSQTLQGAHAESGALPVNPIMEFLTHNTLKSSRLELSPHQDPILVPAYSDGMTKMKSVGSGRLSH